jgi:predicted nucleic acid-binding protein
VGSEVTLLLDSNVLIDVLRGERQALDWLEVQAEGLAISVISWIEVLVGCEGVETDRVRSWLEMFRQLGLDQAVAAEAVACRKEFRMRLPDAVILATARCHGMRLVTRNTRDFPESLGMVLVPYRLG